MCQIKEAQDGSEECSVFYVWSGYFKMWQNKGAQDGSQGYSVFYVWSGYFKLCQNKGRRMGPGMFSFLCVVRIFQDMPK